MNHVNPRQAGGIGRLPWFHPRAGHNQPERRSTIPTNTHSHLQVYITQHKRWSWKFKTVMQQEVVLTEMQELRHAMKLECWKCKTDFACLVLEMQYKGQAPHPIAFGGGSTKLAVETLEPHCLRMGDLLYLVIHLINCSDFSVSKLSIVFRHRASHHMPLANRAGKRGQSAAFVVVVILCFQRLGTRTVGVLLPLFLLPLHRSKAQDLQRRSVEHNHNPKARTTKANKSSQSTIKEKWTAESHTSMNEQKAEQQKRTKRQEQRNMQQKSNYRKIKHAN